MPTNEEYQMAKPNTHVVVGIGDNVVTDKAIIESLRDIVGKQDVVSIVWVGKPIAPAVEFVYNYIMDNGILFQMYYEEGQNPPRVFRESDHGSVFKVRDSVNSALKSITGSGKVLFLWNDAENDTDHEDGLGSLIDQVFDTVGEGTIVLDLTNGLSPIEVVGQSEGDLLAEVQSTSSRYDDDDDEDTARSVGKAVPAEELDEPEVHATGVNLVDTVEAFTKAELENMPARAVKAYGEKKGIKAATAKGIIAELFPDDEAAYHQAHKDDPTEWEEVRSSASKEEDVMGMILHIDSFLVHTFGDKYAIFEQALTQFDQVQ